MVRQRNNSLPVTRNPTIEKFIAGGAGCSLTFNVEIVVYKMTTDSLFLSRTRLFFLEDVHSLHLIIPYFVPSCFLWLPKTILDCFLTVIASQLIQDLYGLLRLVTQDTLN